MRSERTGLVRRPRTVRSQVTLLATALVALVLALSAVGLIETQQRVLTHGIDESLRQRADNIAADVRSGLLGDRLPSEADPEDSFVQVVGPEGTVLAASENAAMLPPAGEALSPDAEQQIVTAKVLLDSQRFRVLTRPLDTVDGPRTLVVAKNLDDVDESVRILIGSLLVSIPVVAALLALVLWYLTGRVLRSVETIRAEVASIEGTELHRRVPEHATGDEISRLARTMNQMLDRLQQATEHQRRFVADASHELRGPLTRIRSDLEVGLAHPHSVDHVALEHRVLTDTVELQRLIEDLLFLARSESGSLPAPEEPVDLDDLVLNEARSLRDRGRVRVDTSAVSAARTLGDSRQLARAIANLASNAERHAASVVRFELREEDSVSVLVVADDGPGIPEEHRNSVFERFRRLDEARSRDAGGAGLGLAIVHEIVDRHQGAITVGPAAPSGHESPRENSGARFVLSLPRVD